jgi:hypothetical protein
MQIGRRALKQRKWYSLMGLEAWSHMRSFRYKKSALPAHITYVTPLAGRQLDAVLGRGSQIQSLGGSQ